MILGAACVPRHGIRFVDEDARLRSVEIKRDTRLIFRRIIKSTRRPDYEQDQSESKSVAVELHVYYPG